MEWVGILAAIALLALIIRYLAKPEKKPGPSDRKDGSPRFEEPEAVELPIEDHIDLHPFAPDEIPDVVKSYLEAAVGKGYSEVRLIHGRGKGVQRARLQSLLSRHPQVASFKDAPPSRGGWGATLVVLNPERR